MKLALEHDLLRIELTKLKKLLSFRGSLQVPLNSVAMVHTHRPKGTWVELRMSGTLTPWVVKAGTYYTRTGKEFWYVTRHHRSFLTIHLSKGFYRRVILGLDLDETWGGRIVALIG